MSDWIRVAGRVESGYGVASGQADDPRFPQGTLALQRPLFAQQGLDLSDYFSGTINVSITPSQYQIQTARYTFRQVKWSSSAPAEDFSFFDCHLLLGSAPPFSGLIYYPHPETKPEHFQSPTTLEIITVWIEGLKPGDALTLEVNPQQITIY